jgi:hypothetical protein
MQLPYTHIVHSDPYNAPADKRMEFRLIYGGLLLGASKTDTRSTHKDDIRRVFHLQLKHLWKTSPALREWVRGVDGTPAQDYLAEKYQCNGVSFIPLVTEHLGAGVKLDILMLRPDQPGMTLMQSGDIDNRLKTIFDALRIPLIGERCDPQGEKRIFCLLDNDNMVNHISITTDLLLGEVKVNEVRLIITVTIWPITSTIENMGIF